METLLFLGEGAISYKIRWPTVCTFSAEVEFMTAVSVAKGAKFLKSILKKLAIIQVVMLQLC